MNPLQMAGFPTVPGLNLKIRDGIVTILFDRAGRKNAINAEMWGALPPLFKALGADGETRVVVIEGEGADFSAGADISEFDTVRKDAATARDYEALNAAAFRAVREFQKPVIAAIRGICFGGGFGIAAAADIRIATPDARFSVPAAKLGLAYPREAMVDIVSALGAQMARVLTYTAAVIGAEQALACGFLAEIVEAESFEERLSALAHQIAENAPLSIMASKAAIRSTITGKASDIAEAERLGDLTFDSADYAEGRRAFREKRKPEFTGA